MIDIVKRLWEPRKARRLSQAYISRKSGLMPKHISRMESGKIIPTLPILEKLAKGLGVELFQFFVVRKEQEWPIQ
jgi:transcriptional regulator with XRE-family HTH domain